MLSIPQMIIAILLYFVLFFGIGFILNMLLRASWVMAVIYPVVVLFMVDNQGIGAYFSSPGDAFSDLGSSLVNLPLADMIILSSGMVGALLAGVVIRMLRNRGYQMF
ncbi:YuiB family protein [Salisediminibacterium selenitireducens]|nr:YuiB family protein [Salisediminibacterium selenitireducens]